MMKRRLKIFLLPALLAFCASVSLWHARGFQGEGKANQAVQAANSTSGQFGNVTAGAFVLKRVTFKSMMTSAILKGEIVNETNRDLDEATFEIKAYDRDGHLLKGAEEQTIFTVHQLKAGASLPLNYGYGVWLQGISTNAISRIELIESSDEPTAASLSMRMLPLASHAFSWQKDSELEE